MTIMVDSYIHANAYTSVKWQVFQAHVRNYINSNYDAATASKLNGQIDWETWVYGPGLAPVHLDFTTKGLNDSLALVGQYMDGSVDHAKAKSDWNNEFKSTTKTIFTQKLNTEFNKCGVACINSTIFNQIDADMNITGEINPDVKQQW